MQMQCKCERDIPRLMGSWPCWWAGRLTDVDTPRDWRGSLGPSGCSPSCVLLHLLNFCTNIQRGEWLHTILQADLTFMNIKWEKYPNTAVGCEGLNGWWQVWLDLIGISGSAGSTQSIYVCLLWNRAVHVFEYQKHRRTWNMVKNWFVPFSSPTYR